MAEEVDREAAESVAFFRAALEEVEVNQSIELRALDANIRRRSQTEDDPPQHSMHGQRWGVGFRGNARLAAPNAARQATQSRRTGGRGLEKGEARGVMTHHWSWSAKVIATNS